MATLPADTPPLASATVPGMPAGAIAARRAAEWTTSREVALDCEGCGARFVLSYKYRFAEGLGATLVRCPAAACRRGREYFLPVNAFDVRITPGDVPPPPIS